MSFTGTVQYGRIEGPTPHLIHCEEYDISAVGSRCGNADIDPGEVCDDGNLHNGDCCSSGFTYKDRAGSVGGISSLVAHTNGIRVKGRGDALPLPAAIPLSPLRIEPYLIASDGVTTKCWAGTRSTDATVQTETELKLRYRR